jgi:hypothetical protein
VIDDRSGMQGQLHEPESRTSGYLRLFYGIALANPADFSLQEEAVSGRRQGEPKGDVLAHPEIASHRNKDTTKAYVLDRTDLSAMVAVEIDGGPHACPPGPVHKGHFDQ